MISAQSAIRKTRRDLALGTLVRWVLLSVCMVAVLGQSFVHDAGATLMTVFSVAGGSWIILMFQSMRGSRMAADSSMLIAAGQYEAAEEHLEEAIGSFSMFRSAKLICLHHLAVLRHAQNRWQDAAALSNALLRQQRSSRSFDRASRLILIESLLRLGDVAGAGQQLAALAQQRLSLPQALQWLSLQLDYSARMQDWRAMMSGVASKAQLLELLPGPASARAHALLALAATELRLDDWKHWLARRAELLVDREKLITDTPGLARVWN